MGYKQGFCTDAALETNTKVFAMYGFFVCKRTGFWSAIVLGIAIAVAMGIGIIQLEYENNLDNLWIEKGSRAEEETNFFNRVFGGDSRLSLYIMTLRDKRTAPKNNDDFGMLTKEAILAFRDVTADIQSPNVNEFSVEAELPLQDGTSGNINITLPDICDRPRVPPSMNPWRVILPLPGPSNFNSVKVVGSWLAQGTTDSGTLHFITNCFSGIAANTIANKPANAITVAEFIQLQMWYNLTPVELNTLLATAPLSPERLAVAASKPGLPLGWGVLKFPCTRGHILDCYSEGIYDYTPELIQLNSFGTAIAGLTDAVTVDAGPFSEKQLEVIASANSEFTWNQQCFGGLIQVIKSAVRLANEGVPNDPVEQGKADLVVGQAGVVAVPLAVALGYHWRPSMDSLGASEDAGKFAFNTYKALKNGQDFSARECVAEGIYRRLDSIRLPDLATPFYAISPFTPLDGGCCINWAGVKVTPRLFTGISDPDIGDFDPTDHQADPTQFRAFVPALRITNSNISPDSVFIKARLAREIGVDPDRVTSDQLLDIIEEWEQNAIDYLNARFTHQPGSGFADGEDFDDYHIVFILDRSTNDLLDDASNVSPVLIAVGYVILISYCCFCFISYSPTSAGFVYSRGFLCFIGVCVIGTATTASYGLMGWVGLKLSPVNSTLVPFLSIGLGVDDIFVILQEYVCSSDDQDYVQDRVVKTMMGAGSSVTVTSASNIAAFLIPAILVRLPAVYTFAYQMTAAVAFNWLFQMLLFVPAIVVDAERSARRRSMFPCISTTIKESTVYDKEAKYTLTRFTDRVLCPLLSNLYFKIFGISAWVAITIWLSIHGFAETTNGLLLSDVTISGHYVKDYLEVQQTSFPILPGSFITREVDFLNPQGDQVSFPEYQESILRILEDTATDEYLDKITRTADLHFLPGFIDYFKSLPETFLTLQLGIPPAEATTSARVNLTTVPTEYFYPLLANYLSTVGATDTENLVCRRVSTGELGDCTNVDGTTHVIAATRATAYYNGLFTDDDYTKAVKSLRKSTDDSIGNFNDCCNEGGDNGKRIKPAQNFFAGYLFKFWQQYVTIRNVTLEMIGFSLLGVGVALLIFQASPWSSILVVVFILTSILQMFGIMAYMDIKLNGFSATNLSIGIGMGVQYAAHLSYAFLRANALSDDRDERMRLAVKEIFPPMFNGAWTGFVSSVVLAFAKYPFFKLYYFEMTSLLNLLSFINGMIIFPMVLSLVGPRGLSAQDVQKIAQAQPHPDTELELQKR